MLDLKNAENMNEVLKLDNNLADGEISKVELCVLRSITLGVNLTLTMGKDCKL